MNIKEADIIRMALEVGAEQVTDTLFYATIFELQRFAELVAEHERKECAAVCEDVKQEYESSGHKRELKYTCADAIRARGKA